MKRKVFFILIFLFIFSCFHSAIGEYRKETVIVEFFEAPLCENDRSLFSVDSYAFIQKEQAHFLSVAEEELNRKIEPIYTYSHVMNGMALNLYPDEMKEIKNHPLVKSVREEKIYKELRAPSNAEMMCGTEYVWASGYEGEGMVIAIIDSECDTDHSMFTLSDESTAVISYADIEQKLSSLNLLSKKLMPQVTAADIYKSAKIPYAFNYGTASSDCNNPISTHGTHVTGIAAANNKNAYANGVDGVAPEAQLYILSCMNANGELPEHTLLAALEDAVLLEADVINCSWGIEGGVTNDSFFSKIINRINQNGVIVCCAAGNEGKAAKNNSYGKQTILASYTDFGTLSTPAAATGALSVGACSTAFTPDSASLAYFSSWGTSSALEIKPEILAPGNAIYSTQSENLYGTMSGTSMATPFMSGACALMLQHVKKEYPTFSPFQRAQLVKQLLASSAVLLKSEGNYVSPRGQGAGVVQIANALTLPTVLYGEDGEPHLELGDNLKDSFTFSFYAENITEQELTFTVKGCVLNDEASYAGTVKDYVVTNTAPFPEASMLLEGTQINENHRDYKARTITLLPKEKKKITIMV